MVYQAGASHIASCLSIADLLAILYGCILKVDPKAKGHQRDRFLLSKGHAAAALYATLAECGFFPIEDLDHYRQAGSLLLGHSSHCVRGVELSTGSLGHALPVACGLALAAKRDGRAERVFALLSDGELDEGSNWEAALFAPHHQLDNLTVIIDFNKIQSFGAVRDVLDLDPIGDKSKAFRWATREIDGHDLTQILSTLNSLPIETGKPSFILANTIKGKGVSFMEGKLVWHYKSPTAEFGHSIGGGGSCGMRAAFIEELCLLAELNPNLWLVCGDLGYGVLERFAERFANRFLNVGVAEQNMTGVAAGLAMSGKTVFTYSIANFPVIRCLEQIRNDVCYHNLDVKVVAVGGGLAYGGHGYTHHGIEDFAVMGALPNLTIAAPGDPVEARAVTRLAANTPGPAYLRLGKSGEPRLHTEEIDMQIGRALKIRLGSDLKLISTGGMLSSALSVAEMLGRQRISAAILSIPYLVPFDEAAILEAARKTPALLTIEEHGWGGLGTVQPKFLRYIVAAFSFSLCAYGLSQSRSPGHENSCLTNTAWGSAQSTNVREACIGPLMPHRLI
jgi:transketolase